MDQLTTKAETTIEKYERSTGAAGVLEIEVSSGDQGEDEA